MRVGTIELYNENEFNKLYNINNYEDFVNKFTEFFSKLQDNCIKTFNEITKDKKMDVDSKNTLRNAIEERVHQINRAFNELKKDPDRNSFLNNPNNDEIDNTDGLSPEEILKTQKTISEILHIDALKKIINSNTGKMVIEVLLKGPGMVDDINIIRSLWRDLGLFKTTEMKVDQLQQLNLMIEHHPQFQTRIRDCMRLYGSRGVDRTNREFLNAYTAPINRNGSFRQTAINLKNKYNEESFKDLEPRFKVGANTFTKIMNPIVQICSYPDMRRTIGDIFKNNNALRSYTAFLNPMFTTLNNDKMDDINNFRLLIGLYYDTIRNSNNRGSIFEVFYTMLVKTNLFNEVNRSVNIINNRDRNTNGNGV